MKAWITYLFPFVILGIIFNILVRTIPFYNFLYWQLNLPVEKNILTSQSSLVLRFVHDQQGLAGSVFNEKEIIHLHDIKSLLSLERLIFISFVDIFLVLYLYYIIKKKGIFLTQIFIGASKTGMAVCAALFLSGLFLFSPLFYYFHVIFFTNDFWQLNPATDMLINIFPPEFFLLFFVYYSVLSFSFFFVAYGIARSISLKFRK